MNEIVFLCPTLKEVEELFSVLASNNAIWKTGRKVRELNVWQPYGKETCFRIQKDIMHLSCANNGFYLKNGYNIQKIKDSVYYNLLKARKEVI